MNRNVDVIFSFRRQSVDSNRATFECVDISGWQREWYRMRKNENIDICQSSFRCCSNFQVAKIDNEICVLLRADYVTTWKKNSVDDDDCDIKCRWHDSQQQVDEKHRRHEYTQARIANSRRFLSFDTFTWLDSVHFDNSAWHKCGTTIDFDG